MYELVELLESESSRTDGLKSFVLNMQLIYTRL